MLAANSLLSSQVTVTGLPVNLPDEPYGSHLHPVPGKNIPLRRQINPSLIKNIKPSAEFKNILNCKN